MMAGGVRRYRYEILRGLPVYGDAAYREACAVAAAYERRRATEMLRELIGASLVPLVPTWMALLISDSLPAWAVHRWPARWL